MSVAGSRSSSLVASGVALVAAAALVACTHPSAPTVPAAPPSGAPVTQPTAPVTQAPPAPAPPPAPVKVRSLEGIDEYQLANGLRVLLFPDPSQSTVTVNITYFVGSRHEGYGETGMAHLLEHMMFKGTPRHRNVLKLLDERGAFANGTTWTDRTNYFETLPASGDNLRWALDLEADRMINASISEDDLSTEFSVVRNELEAGENRPRAVLEERIVSSAYLWHNYGKSTIGSRSDVENVPVSRLRPFYARYYQPDNALLIVAGKFDPAAALADINAHFGVIPRPTRALPPSYTVEPVQDGERSVILRRTGDVHLIMALYHAVAGADPDNAAFDALDHLLTDAPTGRLYRKLVKPGLAAEVWGSHYLWRDPGFLILGVKARDARSVDKAEAALLSVVEGLAREPVTQAEVDRFKASRLKDLTLLTSDTQQLSIELSEWAATGDWRLLFAYRDRVKALTAADVQRVATGFLKRSNRTLGRFVPTARPDRAPAAPAVDVPALVDDLVASGPVQGEAFVASLDNLEARTTMRDLAGGLRAALLPRKTRGGTVSVTLRFRHGEVGALAGKRSIAEATAAVAARGTRTRSFAAIEEEKDRLTARIRIGGRPGVVAVRIDTVRDSLPAVIDLVADILKHPSFPAAELEVVRREEISDLEERRSDPSSLAQNQLERLLQPWPAGDVRRTDTFDDQIAQARKVKVADLRAYHKAFWGAGHGEVVAIGDFDADALAAQLERHFGTWLGKAPYARIPDQAFGAAATRVDLDTPDKEMAIVIGGHDLTLRDDHADVPALIVASHILGGSTGSRLWMRLREREGYSYGTWGYIEPGDLDPAGQFGFGAIVAPQNLAAARAALLEEVTRMRDQGVTDAEVETARKAWLEQQDNFLADDGILVSILGHDRYLGRDFAWHRALRAKVAAVSAADVDRVVKTWLDPARLIVVTAGDKAKAAAPAGGKPAAP